MIDLVSFKTSFLNRYGSAPMIFSAPGRVNLIGEHTDYNEGFVMPFAIDRQTLVGASRREDRVVNVHTLTLNESVQIDLDDTDVSNKPDWAKYIAGMIEMLKRQGVTFPGADILIGSDIPFGAGLSSSAALEIATGLAAFELSNKTPELKKLAFASQRVEHEFIGVKSGVMDQFASVLSRAKTALLIDCKSFSVEHVPLNFDDAMFAVCDTGVKHSLASSAYNERRHECEQGVKILSEKLPAVDSLRDVEPSTFYKYESLLPEPIKSRCRHVITENVRTIKAAASFRRKDLAGVGRLMKLSHKSLRDDYAVSCAELDLLADTANSLPGVYGARMTGGGFGGCTVNLLHASAFDNFKLQVTERYKKTFGREPIVFPVVPSAGARRVV